MAMNRICFILPRLKFGENGVPIGGAQNSALGLLQELRREGLDVILVGGTPSDSKAAVDAGALGDSVSKIYPLPLPRTYPLRYGLSFLGAIAKLSISRSAELSKVRLFHIHAGYHLYALLGYLLQARFRCPVVLSLYCPLSSKVDGTSHRGLQLLRPTLTLTGISRVIATSQNIARSLADSGVHSDRIVQIPPLPNLEKFLASGAKGDGYSRENDEVVLLFVGNASESKGLDSLFEALGQLGRSFQNWRLMVADENTETKFQARQRWLQATARNKGIDSKIEWREIIPDITELYRDADIVIVPYRDTAGPSDYPLVLLEAMACAKCVIASDLPGISEIVEDGVFGVLVPSGDTRSLADAIRALAQNKDRRRTIGKNGHSRIKYLFDRSTIVASYLEVYRKLGVTVSKT